jgi:hypothetical protein
MVEFDLVGRRFGSKYLILSGSGLEKLEWEDHASKQILRTCQWGIRTFVQRGLRDKLKGLRK